jgi:hypothetical protein
MQIVSFKKQKLRVKHEFDNRNSFKVRRPQRLSILAIDHLIEITRSSGVDDTHAFAYRDY